MAYGFVSKCTAFGSTTSSPTTTTFSGGNTQGNLIVLAVAAFSTGGVNPVTGVTDTIGNTYSLLATVNAGSFAGGTIAFYVANPCKGTGSSNVISVAWTVGTQTRLNAYAVEYSGQAASPFDTATGTNTSGSSISYSITAAKAGELLVSVNTRTSGGPNWSGLSGTDRSGVTGAAFEYNDILSSAAGSNTITATSSATFFGGATIALLPGGSPQRTLLGVGL